MVDGVGTRLNNDDDDDDDDVRSLCSAPYYLNTLHLLVGGAQCLTLAGNGWQIVPQGCCRPLFVNKR